MWVLNLYVTCRKGLRIRNAPNEPQRFLRAWINGTSKVKISIAGVRRFLHSVI